METYLEIKKLDGDVISIEGSVPVLIKKKERNWIAYCPVFNLLGSSSESEESSIEDLQRSLKLFFLTHVTRNTLEVALEHNGWLRDVKTFKKPEEFALQSDIEGRLIKMNLPNFRMAA